jgi:hypothetical protein
MALPIIAALAAPIIGGAMTLAGGAMSLTGGVLTAGSTVAGIAADAAGGVIGAVGGLLGGGKSGNVESSESDAPKTPKGTYISKDGRLRNDGTKGPKGSFASMSGGMSLAKVKSSIDPIGAEGGVSMLPTGKESQVTLLSQILGQIRTNTGALFSIDGKIGGLIDALSTPPPPPPTSSGKLLEGAKKTKGDGVVSKLGKAVTGTFSALGKRLKGLSGSLAGAAKFALKGLLLTGALVLFRKYRENIVGFISRTFEKLSDFVKTFDTKDPIGSFFDKLMSTGEGSILNSLKSGVMFMIDEIINALKLLINDLGIPFVNFDMRKPGVDTTNDDVISKLSKPERDMASQAKVTTVGYNKSFVSKTGLGEGENKGLTSVVTKRIQQMYDTFDLSGGRVQWTNVGTGFTQEGPWSLTNMNPGVTVNDILTSQPIFDGKRITMAKLNAGLDYEAGFEGLDEDIAEKVKRGLAQKSNYRQLTEQGIETVGMLGFRKPIVDKIQGIETKNRELGFNVNKSDAANSVNVINANDQKNISMSTGDKIMQPATAQGKESTALAEFKAAYAYQ